MTSNQLPPGLLPYHLTSFPGYRGSAFGFGVMVIEGEEVTPSAPEGEVRGAGLGCFGELCLWVVHVYVYGAFVFMPHLFFILFTID